MNIDINWAALRDDLYTSRWVIERKLGACGIGLGFLFGVGMIVGHAHWPSPLITTGILVLWCIELAASVVFSGIFIPLPPSRTGYRYRYTLVFDQTGSRLLQRFGLIEEQLFGRWQVLERNSLTDTSNAYRYGFARFEEYALIKLKFSPYLLRDMNGVRGITENGPSAGPHHMAI